MPTEDELRASIRRLAGQLDQDSRRPGATPPMGRRPVRALAVAAAILGVVAIGLVAAVAIGDDAPVQVQTGTGTDTIQPRRPSRPGSDLPVWTQPRQTRGDLALISGTLTADLEGRCWRIGDEDGPTMVWPHGFRSVTFAGDPAIEMADGRILREGDWISGGGGDGASTAELRCRRGNGTVWYFGSDAPEVVLPALEFEPATGCVRERRDPDHRACFDVPGTLTWRLAGADVLLTQSAAAVEGHPIIAEGAGGRVVALAGGVSDDAEPCSPPALAEALDRHLSLATPAFLPVGCVRDRTATIATAGPAAHRSYLLAREGGRWTVVRLIRDGTVEERCGGLAPPTVGDCELLLATSSTPPR